MKEGNNVYAYISIVAIVAIVSVFVMFAGSGSKQTSQPVFTGNLVGDLVGDAITRISSSSNQRCIDTDGGIVPEVFGVVYYGDERYADECINSNELIEYYCDRDRPSRTIIECPRNSVCLNGACVKEDPEDQWCDPEWGIVIPEIDPNLCWQKDVSTEQRNRADSLSYCNNEVTLGNLNWDMPTRTEMVKLRNYACDNKEGGPSCSPCDPYSESYCSFVSGVNLAVYLNNQEGFTGFLNAWYWTSTLWTPIPSNGWVVSLSGINVGYNVITNSHTVVCVSRNSEEVYGCTDPEATNYNPDATIDDGSCKFATDNWCNPEWGIVIPEIDPNLCWQKEVSTYTRNHADSLSYCNNEVTLGNLNWDMPTRTEMVKLRNYACENNEGSDNCSTPCDPYNEVVCDSVSGANLNYYLNNQEGFTGFLNSFYWTSTLFNPNPNGAWNLYLPHGFVINNAITTNHRVVCVSRNSEEVYGCTDPEATNYNPDATIDDGSCEYASDNWCDPVWGIVIPEIDPNLCWQKDVSTEQRNHADSLSYCNNEVTLGNLNWDMPTRTEMVKLRNYACENKEGSDNCSTPCDPYNEVDCDSVSGINLYDYLNNQEGFTGFFHSLYWTSTLFNPNPSLSWNLKLPSGYVFNLDVAYPYGRVVCVSRN